MAFTIDSAFFTVLISASVALAIFGLKEKLIEPNRWKRNIYIAQIEKRLEVYGTLITLLQSFFEKAHRENFKKPGHQATWNNTSHLLEVPYDADKLELLFEKYRYLLSEELIQRYLQYMREDTYFAIYQASKSGQQLVFANFAEMQSIVEKDYGRLKDEYEQFIPSFGHETKRRLVAFKQYFKGKK